jgi:hypothetical protein
MLSTNLPSGTNAVQNHLATRGETRLLSSVNIGADAEYISEKGLRSGNERMKRWPVAVRRRSTMPPISVRVKTASFAANSAATLIPKP